VALVLTHELEVLLGLTQAIDRQRQSQEHWKSFTIVNRWIPAWRYNSDLSNQDEAKDFIDAVEKVSRWIEHNISKGCHMADAQLKQRIREALRDNYFKDADDLVDVSDGSDDNIHVVIVSRKFDGRRMKEKNDLIWSLLVQHLRPEEWGKVSLSVGASPEEIKAM
jgi:stress-induced morphogen